MGIVLEPRGQQVMVASWSRLPQVKSLFVLSTTHDSETVLACSLAWGSPGVGGRGGRGGRFLCAQSQHAVASKLKAALDLTPLALEPSDAMRDAFERATSTLRAAIAAARRCYGHALDQSPPLIKVALDPSFDESPNVRQWPTSPAPALVTGPNPSAMTTTLPAGLPAGSETAVAEAAIAAFAATRNARLAATPPLCVLKLVTAARIVRLIATTALFCASHRSPLLR